MIDDTDIGGDRQSFPATHYSAIIHIRSANEEDRKRAYGMIVQAYWKPVYTYIRLRWNKSNEDAKDLTQGFFAKVLEKDFFQEYDRNKARFRTFLRVCLDRFLSNEEKAAARLKRGGGMSLLSLDFDRAEGELSGLEPVSPDRADDFFDKEWVRTLLSSALDRVCRHYEKEGKPEYFRLFERYYLHDEENASSPSYDLIAAEFGLSTSSVTNHLAAVRRVFRRIALDLLREVTGSEDEFRHEARILLGNIPE